MNHAKVSASAGNACVPMQQLQVDAQLDSASFSMDALESTVNTLISRLTPATGEYPVDPCPPEAPSSLVPIAARISYLEGRVRRVERQLSDALGALQI